MCVWKKKRHSHVITLTMMMMKHWTTHVVVWKASICPGHQQTHLSFIHLSFLLSFFQSLFGTFIIVAVGFFSFFFFFAPHPQRKYKFFSFYVVCEKKKKNISLMQIHSKILSSTFISFQKKEKKWEESELS